MRVKYEDFCRAIAEDFNIELNKKHKIFFNDFPIKNGKRKINSFRDSVIVDNDGNEHPYMLDATIRNDEKLIDFNHIYYIRPKNLKQIMKETNVTLKSEPSRICEGGGWYSNGTRFYYKNIFCDIS